MLCWNKGLSLDVEVLWLVFYSFECFIFTEAKLWHSKVCWWHQLLVDWLPIIKSFIGEESHLCLWFRALIDCDARWRRRDDRKRRTASRWWGRSHCLGRRLSSRLLPWTVPKTLPASRRGPRCRTWGWNRSCRACGCCPWVSIYSTFVICDRFRLKAKMFGERKRIVNCICLTLGLTTLLVQYLSIRVFLLELML